MTTDQQLGDALRDRFDRATPGSVPEPDLDAAIAGGRRRRRVRLGSYAAGTLAVLAVTAAVAAPRIAGGPVPPTVASAVDDGTYVAGTTVDTDLAAVVAAADPSLPAPVDVYPSDWSRDTALPDDQFANATEWQLVYDLSPHVELLVYVSQPVPGETPETTCPSQGGQVVTPSDGTTTVDVPGPQAACVDWQVGPGSTISKRQTVGEPGHERYWFLTEHTAPDGRFVNVIEMVEADDWRQATERSELPAEAALAVAGASGLDFPASVDPPPAP